MFFQARCRILNFFQSTEVKHIRNDRRSYAMTPCPFSDEDPELEENEEESETD